MHFKDRLREMKTIRIIVAAIAIIIAAGVCNTVQEANAGERIAVLVSSQEPPFQETLAGFQAALAKQGIEADYDVYRLAGDAWQAEQAVKKVKQSGPRLIFTLGSLGTDAVTKAVDDIPVVACLILRAEKLRHASNATGVVLEYPLETQFSWMQKILPDAKTIGVMYNPGENQERIDAAQRIARSRGLNLEVQEVYTPQDIPSALNTLSKSVDVLWGLADNLALSPQIAKNILLVSFRNSIPFIGPSSAWVRAGALYSLDWDYADLGAQCGEMALQVLQGSTPSAIPPAVPRKLMYSLNLKTAQQLNITIPEPITQKARNTY
jgi:putative ABC transport system substrate-binding protein